ncbi:MAG: SGNH/GDSL hydrolase family protein [Verrucomicrobia bacterium]|nr:SGNH/GDSL hydrolase family protein [Verrucomicrobiota bacterium]
MSLLTVLCLLEAWFRARATRVVAARLADAGFLVQSDPELLIRSTTRGRRLVPGAHVRILNHRLSGLDIDMQINSLGFRDCELSPRKSPGEFRALVLGDSITWGDYLPAEAVYVEQAERRLNPSLDGRRVELINAGVGDVGIREELEILEESGLAAQPDLVVLSFYVNDSRPPWGFAGEIGRPDWLRRHSALAAEAYRAFRLERWIKAQGEERFVWIYGLGEGQWKRDPAAFDRLAWMARYDWGAAWQPESWSKVEAELARLRRLSARHGFRVLVVAFPVRFQVETEFLDDLPQRELAKRARENGFGFLDLLPTFRSHRGEKIFFDHCHPGAEANVWIGEALARHIRVEYLAPESAGR